MLYFSFTEASPPGPPTGCNDHRRTLKTIQILPSSQKKMFLALVLAVLGNVACTGKCGSLKHSQGLPSFLSLCKKLLRKSLRLRPVFSSRRKILKAAIEHPDLHSTSNLPVHRRTSNFNRFNKERHDFEHCDCPTGPRRRPSCLQMSLKKYLVKAALAFAGKTSA